MTNMFSTDTNPDLTAITEKYKNDPAEMVKALAHSQAHIARLEAEAKDKDQKLTAAMTVEQIYEKLQAQSNSTPQSLTPTGVNQQSVLDDNTLEQKLETMLRKKAEEDRVKTAKDFVQTALLNKYQTVDKARSEMALKAKELGMSAEALDTIALTSPQAFLKLLGIDNTRQATSGAPSQSTIRINGLNETPQPDPFEKQKELVSTDRDKYYSQSTQNEIMNAAMKAAGLQ